MAVEWHAASARSGDASLVPWSDGLSMAGAEMRAGSLMPGTFFTTQEFGGEVVGTNACASYRMGGRLEVWALAGQGEGDHGLKTSVTAMGALAMLLRGEEYRLAAKSTMMDARAERGGASGTISRFRHSMYGSWRLEAYGGSLSLSGNLGAEQERGRLGSTSDDWWDTGMRLERPFEIRERDADTTVTPFLGFHMARGGMGTLRIGSDVRVGSGFTLGVEGGYREAGPDTAESELLLRGALRW